MKTCLLLLLCLLSVNALAQTRIKGTGGVEIDGLITTGSLKVTAINVSGTEIDPSTGSMFSKAVSGDVSITFASESDGMRWGLIATNATGTATLALPDVDVWPYHSTPVLDTGAGTVNEYRFWRLGGVTYGEWIGVANATLARLAGIGAGTAGDGIFRDATGWTNIANIVASASTNTFTEKTFDAAASGNILKQTKYLMLMRPDWGDGAGAVPQTNTFTASGLMHYTFSGNAETNANYVVYELMVPPDIDTSVAMTATFAFISGGADADDVTFHIAYGLGAAGAAYPVALANIATSPIVMTVTPTTPASGDVQTTAAVTLTGWAAAMTPGTPLLISLRRLQNSNDDSARDLYLRIAYGSTL